MRGLNKKKKFSDWNGPQISNSFKSMKLNLILRNQVSTEQQSIPPDTTRFPYTNIKITYKNQFQINTMLEDQTRRKQIEGSK
jgi:hypothetical protein